MQQIGVLKEQQIHVLSQGKKDIELYFKTIIFDSPKYVAAVSHNYNNDLPLPCSTISPKTMNTCSLFTRYPVLLACIIIIISHTANNRLIVGSWRANSTCSYFYLLSVFYFNILLFSNSKPSQMLSFPNILYVALCMHILAPWTGI